MKGVKTLLREQLEAEALALEEKAEGLTMIVPEDAKGAEELFEELLEALQERTKA